MTDETKGPRDSPPFHELLRTARRLVAPLSQKRAAERLEISQPNYCRLENHVPDPGWNTVRLVITVLDLPLEVFFPAVNILAAAARIGEREKSGNYSDSDIDPGSKQG